LKQGWPTDADQKGYSGETVLEGGLSGLVWELSRMSSHGGTVSIRYCLEDRLQGNRKHTKEETKFILSHLSDITKALQLVTEELDREIVQPGGIVTRY